MDEIQLKFKQMLQDNHNIDINEHQMEQFEIYYHELVSWNEKMNLTGITEREQVYIKHFYDSLTLAFYLPMHQIEKLADIGSGAGFPGIPLKICYPHLKLMIVDSLNKRIQFLNNVADKLQLHDVEFIHGRAEDVARLGKHRDQYDLVMARAVARMSVLNEFCLPFVKKDGLFAAMKGNNPDEELKEANRSLKELKGRVVNNYAFQLPIDNAERHIILIKKTFATPAKYPRKAGTPIKSPII